MRVALATLVALGMIFSTEAFASEEKMSGSWSRGDGLAAVRIAPCGSSMCAVNTWVKDSSQGEKVGDRLVMTVRPKADGKMS